ncbi:MAG: type II toxin-antitoxin system RelE/ParE family toxin [Candidatus Roizmanbacteria bacterium]|nr:type II toxin-antitoxin system RelE/ParE family toxin [Candidatus Roizmanbacteria bacterium]MCR4312796.1 type II toxin-antitoxin system RelE/ParE family toxin [Candidatus Roizmanbacteria bacterium]
MKVFKDIRVVGFLNRLSIEDNIKITKTIKLFLDYSFTLPEKYLKKINIFIWELRVDRYRILFGRIKDRIIITNIFYKKTQKTPIKELRLAVKRYKEQL